MREIAKRRRSEPGRPNGWKLLTGRVSSIRRPAGFRDFHYGLPANLRPIPREDVPAEQRGRRDGLDMFGIYLNGCVTSYFLEY